MTEHRVRILMNGVTGRMGRNQHLLRSILAIRDAGGISLGPDETILPEPILVGRNPNKLEKLAQETGVPEWTADLDEALSDSSAHLYFDSQITSARVGSVQKAIAAGKHVYCEKPTALTTADAVELYRRACEAGVKQGVVQDKLWLPGILKVRNLIDRGFFGELYSVRGEFGYWVFSGEFAPAQRPSWNYRKEDGGGIVQDMFPHWRYVIDNLFGEIRSLTATAVTHVEKRWDEEGTPYRSTADDAVYATFRLDDDVVVHFNSSWVVRVRRDDLLTLQVDGSRGSAVAGLRDCWIQPAPATPRPVWNPDLASEIRYRDDWLKLPDQCEYENAFRAQWVLFLRHVVCDEPFPWDLLEGAKGVQLAEKGLEASEKREWLDLPDLTSDSRS